MLLRLLFFIKLIAISLLNAATTQDINKESIKRIANIKVPIVRDREIRSVFIIDLFDKIKDIKGEVFLTGRAARDLYAKVNAPRANPQGNELSFPVGGVVELAVKHDDLETEKRFQRELSEKLNSARRFLRFDQDNSMDPEMMIQDYMLPKFDVISSSELEARKSKENEFFKIIYNISKEEWGLSDASKACISYQNLFPKEFDMYQRASHALDVIEFDLLHEDGKLCSSSTSDPKEYGKIRRKIIRHIKKFISSKGPNDRRMINRVLQIYGNANPKGLENLIFGPYISELEKIAGKIEFLNGHNPSSGGHGLSTEKVSKSGVLWYPLTHIETIGLSIRNGIPKNQEQKYALFYTSYAKCARSFINSGKVGSVKLNVDEFHACIPMRLETLNDLSRMVDNKIPGEVKVYDPAAFKRTDYGQLLIIYRALLLPNLKFKYPNLPGSKNILTRYILYSQVARGFGYLVAPAVAILLDLFYSKNTIKDLDLNDLMPLFLDDSQRTVNELFMRIHFGEEYFLNSLLKFARYPTNKNANDLKLEIFNDLRFSRALEFLENFSKGESIRPSFQPITSEDYDEIVGYDHFSLRRLSSVKSVSDASFFRTYRSPTSHISGEEKTEKEPSTMQPKKEAVGGSSSMIIWVLGSILCIVLVVVAGFLFYRLKNRRN